MSRRDATGFIDGAPEAMSPVTWETERYVVTRIDNPAQLMYVSRKTGWCVRHVFSAVSYMLQGYMWSIRKRGKHRPSWVYFKNPKKSELNDFRDKQNQTPDLIEFLLDNPELAEWWGDVMREQDKPCFDVGQYVDEMERAAAETLYDLRGPDRMAAEHRLNHIIMSMVGGNPYPEPEQEGVQREALALLARQRTRRTPRPEMPRLPHYRPLPYNSYFEDETDPPVHSSRPVGHTPRHYLQPFDFGELERQILADMAVREQMVAEVAQAFPLTTQLQREAQQALARLSDGPVTEVSLKLTRVERIGQWVDRQIAIVRRMFP